MSNFERKKGMAEKNGMLTFDKDQMKNKGMRFTSRLVLALTVVMIASGLRMSDAQEVKVSGDSSNSLATFAGGCFWCMEKPYDEKIGVLSTTSGYSGGEVENPSYGEVTGGKTGHREALQVGYDPKKVSYDELVRIYWVNVDPFDSSGQFCDKGFQYSAAIFYHDEEQKRVAIEVTKEMVSEVKKSGGRNAEAIEKEMLEKIVPFKNFYEAEGYHQDYYKTNPYRYKTYRYLCGRDKRLQEVWGKRG